MPMFPEKVENLNIDFYYKQMGNEELPGKKRGQWGRI